MIKTYKPKLLARTDLITISSSDVLIAPIVTELTKEYDCASFLYVETTKGKFDLLFNSDGELIQPENEQLITNIERYFEKKFKPALMDGEPCCIHSYN